MNQFELEGLWTSAEGIAGVSYRFGARVRVASGEHAGEVARVVALLGLDPTPQYVVELDDGSSDVIAQTALEPTA